MEPYYELSEGRMKKKPLFYDLAEEKIQLPNLENEMSPPVLGGGLTGLVRGLWGWNKK